MNLLYYTILPLAAALDAVAGDPRRLPHPVRWMGRAITHFEPLFRKQFKNEFLAGALFAASLVGGGWIAAFTATRAAYAFNPLAGMALEVILIFYCLSARSLVRAAMEIHALLKAGQVDAARAKVAWIVGRDVAQYAKDDIARATVETVAENFVDGVLAPLFFAALGGAPLALAYKMVNTLDSMVGYKNERYLRFGRFAARMDDAANFIPARLSAPLIALAAQIVTRRHGRRAMATAMAEGSHHSSPNAGYPEAAFAGALAVKLNGPNTYGGVLVDKPYIGVNFGPVTPAHIPQACRLMAVSAFLGVVAAWGVWVLL